MHINVVEYRVIQQKILGLCTQILSIKKLLLLVIPMLSVAPKQTNLSNRGQRPLFFTQKISLFDVQYVYCAREHRYFGLNFNL